MNVGAYIGEEMHACTHKEGKIERKKMHARLVRETSLVDEEEEES